MSKTGLKHLKEEAKEQQVHLPPELRDESWVSADWKLDSMTNSDSIARKDPSLRRDDSSTSFEQIKGDKLQMDSYWQVSDKEYASPDAIKSNEALSMKNEESKDEE